VVRNVFPDLQPYHESLVLSRFVLVDAVPANGESWFLGQVFAAAAREGLRGVVSFADVTNADSWPLSGPWSWAFKGLSTQGGPP
jgi:hypothetical protein